MNDFHAANYRMLQKLLRPVFDLTIDSSIENPHFVPDEGPFVLVANHRSDLDPFIMLANIRRPVNWLAASYLWNVPFVDKFMDSLGAISVSKYRSEIRKAFDRAADCLEMGQGVGIFPEGWKYIAANQFDWEVGDFQTGFARIAIETGSPVVPVALQGLSEKKGKQSFPPAIRKWLDYPIEMQYIEDRCVYKKLHIHVGKPISPPEGAEPTDREAVKAFTEKVNNVVRELYDKLPQVKGFENVQPRPAAMDVPPMDAQAISEKEVGEAALE